MKTLMSPLLLEPSRVSSTDVELPQNGDRMTTTEFLRTFEAFPEIKKAELIEGKVYMLLSLSAEGHAEPDGLLHTWLGFYAAHHRDVKFFANPSLVLDEDNSPQPDCVLCTPPRAGHHVWIGKDKYLHGRPELVCEVAASSRALDLHDKLRVFQRHGIQEYLVWVVREKRVQWMALEDSGYVEIKERGGVIVSRVFPKLALDVKALLKRDGAKVLATLQRHLAK